MPTVQAPRNCGSAADAVFTETGRIMSYYCAAISVKDSFVVSAVLGMTQLWNGTHLGETRAK